MSSKKNIIIPYKNHYQQVNIPIIFTYTFTQKRILIKERKTNMSGVLVINAGYEPLHRVSLKHAIRMLVREVAVVEEHEEGKEIGPFPFPKVLRLIRYVAMKWRHARGPAWSRRRLFARDQGTCGYCGKKGDTIDHVLPLSKGGITEWCNTVVACRKCNHRKGNKTLEETGMKLKYANPREPTWWELNHP